MYEVSKRRHAKFTQIFMEKVSRNVNCWILGWNRGLVRCLQYTALKVNSTVCEPLLVSPQKKQTSSQSGRCLDPCSTASADMQNKEVKQDSVHLRPSLVLNQNLMANPAVICSTENSPIFISVSWSQPHSHLHNSTRIFYFSFPPIQLSFLMTLTVQYLMNQLIK